MRKSTDKLAGFGRREALFFFSFSFFWALRAFMFLYTAEQRWIGICSFSGITAFWALFIVVSYGC